MGSIYDVVSGQQTFESLGDTDTVDVVQLWLQAQPHNVRYPVRIPDAVFSIGAAGYVATASAIRVSAIAIMPEVASMTYTQLVGDSGGLTEWMEVHVQAPNLLLSRALRFPLSYFVPPINLITSSGAVSPLWNPPTLTVQQQIRAEAANLNVISEL